MSPEALDLLARAFLRDGYVVVEDALSPAQLRALRSECDAVTRRYARLGGHPAPRPRLDDTATSRGASLVSGAEEEEDGACASGFYSLDWLSRDFGCVLEVPGCCGCCVRPDPRKGGYRSKTCSVTSTTVDALLKPEGPLGIIARALLKPKSGMFLFNDQYIVKPPFSATARFDWHRDSQWCVAEPKGSAAPKETRDVSYVSLWTALDDVDETNGCVRVMPYPSARVEWTGRRGARDSIAANRREGTAGRYEHAPNRLNELAVARWSSSRSEREKEEMTRAFANVRAMRVRAGSILCLSDEVLHCSGPNASSAARRAWMPQFSKGEVLNADAQPVAMAVPVNDA